MREDEKDGAAVRIPPPLVYLGGVILGVLIDAFVSPLPMELSTGWRIALALAATVPAVVLLAGAIGLFRRTGQDPKPWEPTPVIIRDGVYRFTRNPMYLGLACVQAAIGFALANAWIVILVPVVLGIVYVTAIRHEEAYLERKFADEYHRYKASVRRWI
jgi:protein-S-isoprenylcysteine O-methyltransferase Ste14